MPSAQEASDKGGKRLHCSSCALQMLPIGAAGSAALAVPRTGSITDLCPQAALTILCCSDCRLCCRIPTQEVPAEADAPCSSSIRYVWP